MIELAQLGIERENWGNGNMIGSWFDGKLLVS
jgi:hypothetical protein